MAVQYQEIQELLRRRADLHTRLNLMPYDGTEEFYNLLLRNAREIREIRRRHSYCNQTVPVLYEDTDIS